MSNYITEAFKQFDLLESEDLSLDASGLNELRSFLDDAAVDPDDESIDIYDLEAEAKEDLQKSYEGKVVLECAVCHSHIFEDKENISVDEDETVCKDIECPYCTSNEGYFIVGEIAPYNKEEAEAFNDDELDEVDVEGAADDIDDEDIIEESYRRRKPRRSLKEAWNGVFSPKFILDNSYEIPNREEAKKLSDWLYQEEYDSGFSSKDKFLQAYHWTFDNLYKEFKKETSKVNEAMKLDGVKELYDNDEIRGVEELEGVDELEGVKELHGEKHEAPINESFTEDDDLTQDEKYMVLDLLDEDTAFQAEELLNEPWTVVINTTKELRIYAGEEPHGIELNIFNPPIELKESIEDITVTTEDETMTMTTKEDGGIVVETSPKEKEVDFESEPISDEEMIVPVSDESSEEIDVASDALDDEDDLDFNEVKTEAEDEDEGGLEDLEEFDEDSFDNLGESYLRNCYENVKGFKTSGVAVKKNRLFIEGLITFDSGNKKKTNFVFEALKSNNGKYKFEGYNTQISKGKKTFKLSGISKNKKFVCESLNYNYKSKNELNESVRVYGTVKRK